MSVSKNARHHQTQTLFAGQFTGRRNKKSLSPESTRLLPLEFATWRRLQRLAGQKILVAVSGGCDSVTLLEVLVRLQKRLRLELAVAHVHHGPSPDVHVQQARDRAAVFVRRLARKYQLRFVLLNRERSGAASEEALREFRHESLNELRLREEFAWIALAHHRDDLFETRLLRLIRGTGPAGLPAMRLRGKGARLRPWLAVQRTQIETYARTRQLQWLEDPTNQDVGPLRNWLRREWLPALEAKRPGAGAALARSIALLVSATDGASVAGRWARLSEVCLTPTGIDRRLFAALPLRERRFVLAAYVKRQGARDLSSSRLLEIVKRLKSDQKRLRFRIGELNWVINAEQISIAHV